MSLRSSMWDYFKKTLPNKVKCNICSAVLSTRGSSTSPLVRHLRLKHPNINVSESRSRNLENFHEIEMDLEPITPSVSLNESTEIINLPSTSYSIEAVSKSLPLLSDRPTTVVSHNPNSFPHNSRTKQTTITGFVAKPMSLNKRAKIDEQLLKMIVKDYHGFNIVESTQFKKLISMLNPSYELPSRKVLSNSLLSKMYNQLLSEIQKDINENASYVCLSTDGWTSLKNDSYFAVTAHFIDKEVKLKSYLLSTFHFHGRHTSENIAAELQKVVTEWNLQHKIVACTTDNAANMIKAVQLCKWWHVPCFAHTLNLVVQTSLNIISETREKVKSTIEYFKKSPYALEKLHSIQKQMNLPILNLKQDCPTRWNSTYEMFDRISTVKEPLQSTLAILNPDSVQRLTNEDWFIIEKCCEVLKCFEEVTKEISSEICVTVSKIRLLGMGLEKHCQRLKEQYKGNEKIHALIEKLIEELLSRMNKKFQNFKLISEATVLDPRFREHGFFRDDRRFIEAKELIINKCVMVRENQRIDATSTPQPLVTETSSDKTILTSSSVWEDFDNAVEDFVQVSVENPRAASIIEMDKYLKMPLLARTGDPLLWWKENKPAFPFLFEIMKRRLCVIATSVPCERIFSKQGQTITDRRTRLSTNKVSKIMFLNFNLK